MRIWRSAGGEERFFAGLFLCYGAALLWCAWDVQRRRAYVGLLALVLAGAPHPFFVAMLVLELAIPPLMVLGARRIAKPTPKPVATAPVTR